MNSSLDRLRRLRPILELRGRILRAIREFFLERGFLEVETPVKVSAPAPELHIEPEPAGEKWLRTSPEIHMKQLVAAGYERIFQIGPCFRRGEHGRLHRPEYTMLEWYRAGADYLDALADTKAMILHVARAALNTTRLIRDGEEIFLDPVWEYITVREAFRAYAGWDPILEYSADRFDVDWVDKVLPSLPRNVPVVLADFPLSAAAFARAKPGHEGVAERWELFIGGIELANAYTELTDAEEQAKRFEEWNRQRAESGRAVFKPDENFLAALEEGLPACAGVALGVDRLVLLMAGASSLAEIIPFDEA